jgi:transcriptional regulator with XRE-family HTH domain
MGFLEMGKRLRGLRERAGWSRAELAGKLQISEKELEAYEKEEDFPRIALLIKISKLLQVNVADIFRERPVETEFEVIRAKDRVRKSPLMDVGAKGKGLKEYQYEPLTSSSASKHMDAYLIELPPYQSERPHPDQVHPGEEFIYVIEGRIHGKINEEEFELEAGDALYLRSRSPHSFYNPSDRPAKALTVIYPF